MLFDLGKPLILYSPDGAPSGPGAGDSQEGADQETLTDESQEDESASDDLGLDGDFDPERAKRTIANQRDSEKKLKTQLKEASDQLAKYKEAEAAAAEAKKTELEKLAGRAEKAESQLLEAQELIQGLRLEKAFSAQAAELELVFASTQAADDAFDLIDLDGVEIGEDGKVKGLKKALEALVESRPYLFSSNGSSGIGTPKKEKVPKTPPASSESNPESFPSLVKL